MLEVCIVGGGLAGLALSVSLARSFNDDNNNNIKIKLIELRDFQSKGATLGLALNGQKALEEISSTLLTKLKNNSGILLEETGAYMLPWYRIRDGLLEEARQLSPSSIEILSNTKVISISQIDDDDPTNNKVMIEAITTTTKENDDVYDKDTNDDDCNSNNSTTTKLSFKADCVIGADGLHSTIRTFLPNAKHPIPSGAICWRGFVDNCPDSIELDKIPTTKLIMKGQWTVFIFNYHKVTPNTLCWTVSSKDLSATSALQCLDSLDDDDDIKEKEEIKLILESSSAADWALNHSTELGIVPLFDDDGNGCWGGSGRVTLIGDAAHAVRPASGLGGSLAFEDVVVLTRELSKLKNCNNNGINNPSYDDVISSLREFEKKRLPRCKAIQEDQNRLSEAAYKSDVERKKLEWSKQYREWVFFGPDATPNPPSPMYVSSGDGLSDK